MFLTSIISSTCFGARSLFVEITLALSTMFMNLFAVAVIRKSSFHCSLIGVVFLSICSF